MKSSNALGCPGDGPRTSARCRGTGLRSQLVSTALLAVALPVLLTGGLAAFLLAQHLDATGTAFGPGPGMLTGDTVRMDGSARATDMANRIDGFLIPRIVLARTWASSPAVVEVARASRVTQASQEFAAISADDPADRAPVANAPDLRQTAESFLRRQTTASPSFADISVTDRNGFSVAATRPATGLVRSGEAWWQGAWRDGISVSQIEYDDSAGLRSLKLSVRIEDPADAAPLGVLKTMLIVEPARGMADRTTQAIHDGRVGTPIAEDVYAAGTGSGGARIVNVSTREERLGALAMHAGSGNQRAEFSFDWDRPRADAGDRDTYATMVERLGIDDAKLQDIIARIPDPTVYLRRAEDALGDWRVRLALALAAAGLLSVGFAVVLANAAARRCAAALGALTEMAERSARGERVRIAAIETPREIARLGDAVHRLGRLCTRSREPRPVGSAHAR